MHFVHKGIIVYLRRLAPASLDFGHRSHRVGALARRSLPWGLRMLNSPIEQFDSWLKKHKPDWTRPDSACCNTAIY
jgi:hypothetical protein